MNKNMVSTAPRHDAALFLNLASQSAALSSQADLQAWLQGDVRLWLPHEAMVVGWGDVRDADFHYEVFSGDASLRSLGVTPASMGALIGYLRDCWVAAQHVPCQVELLECEPLLRDCTPEQRRALGGLHTATVHGNLNRARGTQMIFAALSAERSPPAGSCMSLKLLLPLMESAFARISVPQAQQPAEVEEGAERASALRLLSDRERQIMQWVALGKTNPEIGCILSISEFTVKNHMKSIFAKLDVANRAQAVASLTRPGAHA